MTSSTPLPPPTEEQLEALRMVLASAADRYETDPPVGMYLAVLAEGLEVDALYVPGQGIVDEWRFETDYRYARDEVGDDD